MMIILSSKTINLSQLVNSVGMYIFRNFDGAINYKKSSNMFDVYVIVLYEIPKDIRTKYNINDDKYNQLNEMKININITYYDDKLRVNLIEESPDELTLGHKTFSTDKSQIKNGNAYMQYILYSIHEYLIKRLENRYDGYDFIY